MEIPQKFFILTVINIASSALRSVELQQPLILAHRGASGMYPEHTALAYRYVTDYHFTSALSSKENNYLYGDKFNFNFERLQKGSGARS